MVQDQTVVEYGLVTVCKQRRNKVQSHRPWSLATPMASIATMKLPQALSCLYDVPVERSEIVVAVKAAKRTCEGTAEGVLLGTQESR